MSRGFIDFARIRQIYKNVLSVRATRTLFERVILLIMKKKIGLIAASVFVLFAGGVIYHLFWGKLFPYAPFFPGFVKNETLRAVVYIQRDARFDKKADIDAWLSVVEEAHRMKFVRKPKIFIFRDDGNYLRRSLGRVRFRTYPNGSVVVSPWALREADEGLISLEIYLKHELSHVLLYQHMRMIPADFSFPRWLLEGVAVFRSGQRGTSWYPGKAETLQKIREGNFMLPGDFGKKSGDRVKLDVQYRSAFIRNFRLRLGDKEANPGISSLPKDDEERKQSEKQICSQKVGPVRRCDLVSGGGVAATYGASGGSSVSISILSRMSSIPWVISRSVEAQAGQAMTKSDRTVSFPQARQRIVNGGLSIVRTAS